MNNEFYIAIGLCIFAFLIGSKIRRKLSLSKQRQITSFKNKTKNKRVEINTTKTNTRKKIVKRIFIYIQLLLVFALLIFMIPALSRDILTNQGVYDDKLILRIVIVALSVYIIFMGYIKITKPEK